MLMTPQTTELSVRDFGAFGDGSQDDTDAFVQAIESIERNGGGRLIVVGGNTEQENVYNIRPINLTSHMELFIEAHARIRGISDASLWPVIPALPSFGQGRDHIGPRHTSLIHGEHLVNVTIRGEDSTTSIIDGNGEYWWKRHNHDKYASLEGNVTRGSLIELMYTTDLSIYNIRLQNSPFWTVHPYDCENIHIRNVHIVNPQNTPNTDGFDPDSSRNVLIEDCSYDGGDDCVAIKSGWDCFGVEYGKPASYITIRNLTCWTNPVCLGSENSGGIEHVLVDGLYFPRGTYAPLKLKSGRARGGYMRNITVRNVHVSGRLKGSAVQILMDLYPGKFGSNPSCPANWTPPHESFLEDLTLLNWNGMAAHLTLNTTSFEFLGISPESPIRNVFMQDIYFQGRTDGNDDDGGGGPTWKCSNFVNITAVNGTITPWPPCKGVRVVDRTDHQVKDFWMTTTTASAPPPIITAGHWMGARTAVNTGDELRRRRRRSSSASTVLTSEERQSTAVSQIFASGGSLVTFLNKNGLVVEECDLPGFLFLVVLLLVLLAASYCCVRQSKRGVFQGFSATPTNKRKHHLLHK